MATPLLDTILPNSQQYLLLQAALGQEGESHHAWQQWAANNDLNDLDGGSFRLLPLVYRNLQQQGKEKDLDPRVKGIYRYWWVRQRRLLSATKQSLQALQDAGIPILVLKGIPLSHTVYTDPVSRTMEDADVCVPLPEMKRALAILQTLGWKMRREEDEHSSLRHEITLVQNGHIELDLQRFAFEACRWHAFNEVIFSRSHCFDFYGTKVLMPRAEDHLILICSHGLRWSHYPTFQWVPDAILLLRHIEKQKIPLDWDAVVQTSQQVRLTTPLYDALCYLSTHFAADVPTRVLQALKSTRQAFIYRGEYHAKLKPYNVRGALWRHAALYNRIRRDSNEKMSILRYYRKYWSAR